MSPIIEVLIGMIFLYSLLSILVTQINAVIATSLKLRTYHLRETLGEMIQDTELYAKFITHPLIRMVEGEMLLPEQRVSEDQAQTVINATLKNVGEIPASTFVDVLMSLIRVDSDKELFRALLDVIDGMPAGEERRRLRLAVDKVVDTGEGIRELQELIDTLDNAPPYRDALNQALVKISQEIADLGLAPNSNISLMAGLRDIKNAYFRNALNTILSTSRTMEDAEKKLEQWFNDGAARADDAYKRSMHRWSLIIGVIIALTLNVDSLFMAQQLWNDQTLRSSVVSVVESTDIAALEAAQAQAQNATTNDQEATTDDVVTAVEAVGETLNDIVSLRVPMGWSFESLSDIPENDVRIGNPRYVWNFLPWNYGGWFTLLLAKLVGLGATMIAIAQGAPFWFGILKRLSGGATGN